MPHLEIWYATPQDMVYHTSRYGMSHLKIPNSLDSINMDQLSDSLLKRVRLVLDDDAENGMEGKLNHFAGDICSLNFQISDNIF